MQHTSLVAFLNGMITPEEFGRTIEAEVDACERGFHSKAGVGRIVITDGPLTILTQDHARLLLNCILEDRLPFKSANYTAECITMSDDFEFQDDMVAEAIQFISDDSRTPTSGETKEALAALNSSPHSSNRRQLD